MKNEIVKRGYYRYNLKCPKSVSDSVRILLKAGLNGCWVHKKGSGEEPLLPVFQPDNYRDN